MEVIKRQMATWFVAIVGILAFTSCDEDWWDNWEPNVNLTFQGGIVPIEQAIHGHSTVTATLMAMVMACSLNEGIGVRVVDGV